MNELIDFAEKLFACDFIALTPVTKDRMYCRFYANGLYFDRMFVSNLNLLEELVYLCKDDDEVIDETSITRLKDKYNKMVNEQNEESCRTSPEIE